MGQKRSIWCFVKGRKGFSSVQTVLLLSILITLIAASARIFFLNLKNASAVQDQVELELTIHNVYVSVDAAMEHEIRRLFQETVTSIEKDKGKEQAINQGSEEQAEETSPPQAIINSGTENSDEEKIKQFMGIFVQKLQANASTGHKLIEENIQSLLFDQEEVFRKMEITVMMERPLGTAKIKYWQVQRAGVGAATENEPLLKELDSAAQIEKNKLFSSQDLMIQIPIRIFRNGQNYYTTKNYYLNLDQAIVEGEDFNPQIHLIAEEIEYARFK